MRRLLAMVSLTLASVLLVAGGAVSPASAAPVIGENTDITVSGWMHIKDEEVGKDSIGNHPYGPGTLHLPTNKMMSWTRCQGGEVMAWLDVEASPIAGTGWASVKVGVGLYEGIRCPGTWDLEEFKQVVYWIAPNSELDEMVRVDNHETWGDDYAEVHIHIRNDYKG